MSGIMSEGSDASVDPRCAAPPGKPIWAPIRRGSAGLRGCLEEHAIHQAGILKR